MAPRLTKRLLQLADFKSPDKVQDILNPALESLSGALAGGITIDNLKHVTVTAKLTPPDEWTPLELLNGATVYNPAFGVPAVRWTPLGTEYRGLVTRPAAGASFVPFARIPDEQATLRPLVTTPWPVTVNPYVFGTVEISTSGNLSLPAPSTFAAGGWISLTGIRHPCSPNPPSWVKPLDVALLGERSADYGTPAYVLVLDAVRVHDKVVCHPEAMPMWETPVVPDGRKRERKLRIRRLAGLEAGVEHLVTFLCLYA